MGGMTTKRVGGGSASTSFDGNRPIKSLPSIGFTPGTNDVASFLEKAFYKFIKASISLNSGTSYYEIGSTANISLSGTITANDETVFTDAKIEVSDGDIINLPNASGAYSTQDDGVEVDVEYIAKVTGAGQDGNSYTVASATKRIRFIYASYFGKNTTGAIPTATEIKAGTKRIVLTGSFFTNNPNTTDSEFGWFAVPHDQTNKIYTTWYVDALNNAAIGSGEFIEYKNTVDVDGVSYDVYIYGYASALTNNLKLS